MQESIFGGDQIMSVRNSVVLTAWGTRRVKTTLPSPGS